MTSCIFCEIIGGNIPAHKIYEDEKVIAILDLRQVRPGHCMVIPKTHIDHFIDLDDDLTAHITQVGNRIGRKMQKNLNPKRVGFAVAGFGVPHAHYHVIPMHAEFDVTSSQYATLHNGKIEFRMDHIPIATDEENKRMVDLLKL